MFDFCFMLKYFLFSKVGKNNKKNVNENENYKKRKQKNTLSENTLLLQVRFKIERSL